MFISSFQANFKKIYKVITAVIVIIWEKGYKTLLLLSSFFFAIFEKFIKKNL